MSKKAEQQKKITSVRERWRYMPRLLTLLWQLGRKEVCIILSLALVTGVVPFTQLTVMQRLIDAVTGMLAGKVTLWEAVLWLLVLLLLYLFGSLLQACSEWVGANVQERLKIRVQEQLLQKAGRISLASFEYAEHYNTLTRAQRGIDQRLFSTLAFICQWPGRIFAGIGLLLYVSQGSLWFPLLLVVGSTCALIVRIRFFRRMYIEERERTEDERMLWYLQTTMTSRQPAAELRLFNLQHYFLERRYTLFRKLKERRLGIVKDQMRTQLIVDNGQSLVLGLVLVGVVILVTGGGLSVGQYAAYVNAVEQFQGILFSVLWDAVLIDNDLLYILDLFAYLDLPEGQRGNVEKPLLPEAGPDVVFEDVSFTYPGTEQPVLQHINLRIGPGERIALVGDNGAGKSTLAKILLGLYTPNSGRVVVNGVDMRDLDERAWQVQCAAVFQDFVKYQVSAYDNIALGDVKRYGEREAVEVAATKSGAHQLVQDLPKGYETVLGKTYEEDGHDLSGGQWQKLAIARAYLREASLLVLDEPTAALDARAEVEVYKQFRDVSQGRSALLISHRLGSARLADRIVVLEKGCIVEQGTHEELLKQQGAYAKMFELQAQWYV